MPAQIKKRRTARRTRKNIRAGKNKKEQGRKRNERPSPNTPAIIANSLFALTLKPISGISVECKKSSTNGSIGLFSDIAACFINGLGGDADALPAEDLPEHVRLEKMIKLVRKQVPPNHSINIEIDKGKYCLAVYHNCSYANYLPGFQVGPTIMKLKTDYPKLHDIFIYFLQAFIKATKVDTWWDDIFQRAIEVTEETLSYEDPDMDAEYKEHAIADVELYLKGAAKKYENKLSPVRKALPTIKILSLLNRLKKKHPVIQIIRKGCEIIDAGVSMFSYQYKPDGPRNEDDWDYEPLYFVNQAMIYWNYDGPCADDYGEWVDSHANEGGIDIPVYVQYIKPNEKEKFDIEKFRDKCLWPVKLVDFFSDVNDITKKYSKKYSKK